MTDHSQAEHALDEGWRPMSWTRDYEKFRAVIMQKPDGSCLWRLYPFDQPKGLVKSGKAENVTGECESLAKANEVITRIARANPLIISGAATIIR